MITFCRTHGEYNSKFMNMQIGNSRPERTVSDSTIRQPNILSTISSANISSANISKIIPRDVTTGKFISKHISSGNISGYIPGTKTLLSISQSSLGTAPFNILASRQSNILRSITENISASKTAHQAASNIRDQANCIPENPLDTSDTAQNDPISLDLDCDTFLMPEEPSRIELSSAEYQHQPSESIGDPFDMDDALMLDALASSMADSMMVDTVLDRAMDPSELIIKSVEEILREGRTADPLDEERREEGKRKLNGQDEDDQDGEEDEEVNAKRRRTSEEEKLHCIDNYLDNVADGDTLEENINPSKEFGEKMEEDIDIVDAEAEYINDSDDFDPSEDAAMSIKKYVSLNTLVIIMFINFTTLLSGSGT